MPLVIAPLNVELRVIKILVDEKTKKHLENLGITIDSMLQVIESNGGSLILLVKDGRLAIDKNVATKILVRVSE